MKIDLHVHTNVSKDSGLSKTEINAACKTKGIDGVCITEHDFYDPKRYRGIKSIKFVGEEILSTSGDILAFGINEQIKRLMSAEETIETIREQGGIAIAPHPFDIFRKAIGKKIYDLDFDAVEAVNARCYLKKFNAQAHAYATLKNLPTTAGSDAHFAGEIGNAFTEFPEWVNDVDDAMKAIKTKKVKIQSIRSSRRYHLKTQGTVMKKTLKSLLFMK
ncbi:MAG: PHP domain-containing protein [Candidatus Diapherotrites archaeon]|nr:PHP domain-containing protein [Candidatus Diapherotrites archaeon]